MEGEDGGYHDGRAESTVMKDRVIEILTSEPAKEVVYNTATFAFALLGLLFVIPAGVTFGVLPVMMGWGMLSAVLMSAAVSIALAYIWRGMTVVFIYWLRRKLWK